MTVVAVDTPHGQANAHLHPADDPAPLEPGNGLLEAQVLAVSEQHVAGLNAAEAAEFTAELADSGAAPRSLTAGQRL